MPETGSCIKATAELYSEDAFCWFFSIARIVKSIQLSVPYHCKVRFGVLITFHFDLCFFFCKLNTSTDADDACIQIQVANFWLFDVRGK